MINWTTLPPLTALRAFSALAEHGSVVSAGQALNVSHAAISQQIKALETHTGLSLVDRSRRELSLTDQGVQLARALSRGFGIIAHEIESLTHVEDDRPLQISTTQLFAASWLMPRLSDFQKRHPEISILINPTPNLSDPSVGGTDVALRFGLGDWPGLEAELLVPSDMAVSAAPSLMGDTPIQSPEDLLSFPWLQETGLHQATDWFHSQGIKVDKLRTLEVPGDLMLDAAKRGQGVMITAYANIEADVKAGNLKALFRDHAKTGYYIVTRSDILRPQTRAFIKWLRLEAST